MVGDTEIANDRPPIELAFRLREIPAAGAGVVRLRAVIREGMAAVLAAGGAAVKRVADKEKGVDADLPAEDVPSSTKETAPAWLPTKGAPAAVR